MNYAEAQILAGKLIMEEPIRKEIADRVLTLADHAGGCPRCSQAEDISDFCFVGQRLIDEMYTFYLMAGSLPSA